MLSGRTAVVTGGSRGLGRAMALSLAAAGARVAFCHPDDPAAPATLRALSERTDALACAADVSSESAVVRLFSEVCRQFGPPDILINNAGILHEASIADTEMVDFDRVLAVNLRGSFLCARAFVRARNAMQPPSARPGRIINIASDLAHLGRADLTAYAASKGAILSMTRSLARELAPDILVNAIAPGAIDTDMTSPESMSAEQRALDLATPLARYGTPDEIAGLAIFLASDQASFITGQCFGVNGGSVMA